MYEQIRILLANATMQALLTAKERTRELAAENKSLKEK